MGRGSKKVMIFPWVLCDQAVTQPLLPDHGTLPFLMPGESEVVNMTVKGNLSKMFAKLYIFFIKLYITLQLKNVWLSLLFSRFSQCFVSVLRNI